MGGGGIQKRESRVSTVIHTYVSISRLRGAGIYKELAEVQPYASYGCGALSALPIVSQRVQTLHRVIHTVAHAASIELLETACSTWCSRSVPVGPAARPSCLALNVFWVWRQQVLS